MCIPGTVGVGDCEHESSGDFVTLTPVYVMPPCSCFVLAGSAAQRQIRRYSVRTQRSKRQRKALRPRTCMHAS